VAAFCLTAEALRIFASFLTWNHPPSPKFEKIRLHHPSIVIKRKQSPMSAKTLFIIAKTAESRSFVVL
jgi:hypothetical protein